MKSVIFLSLGILMMTTGCDQPAHMEAVGSLGFQSPFVLNPTDGCTGAVIKHQYIVTWKNGAITKEYGESDDSFAQNFIGAFKDQIQLAEPDMTVTIPEAVQALIEVQTVTRADNWGAIKVEAGKVWQQGVYGQGALVAVVDTGIDRSHPQLAPRLALNTGEMGTDAQGRDKSSNGVDDDKNGFVDDWNGWNFVARTNSPLDDNGHGTHVSGIIAAQHSDTVAQAANYVQGIAPKAVILPLKFLDSDGTGALSDAVSAINYAVARGANVINASWGGTACSVTLRSAIANLVAKNILFVVAAGNDSVDLGEQPRYPASFSYLSQLTVGATGLFDSMATYSNYGTPSVHLFAPGTLIISTFPNATMAALSGTSMATPFVTGTAALLYGTHPDATLTQIRGAILGSVFKNSQYLNQTQGRLDLSGLLAAIINAP